MCVKECSRYNCESIMCDRYSRDYGYICYTCFEELVASGATTNIGLFMDTRSQIDTVGGFERYNAVFSGDN